MSATIAANTPSAVSLAGATGGPTEDSIGLVMVKSEVPSSGDRRESSSSDPGALLGAFSSQNSQKEGFTFALQSLSPLRHAQ
jgi:hypothetical protein